MDAHAFDRWTRSLASRRSLFGGLASALAVLGLGPASTGVAQSKPKPKPKSKCKALGRPCTRQLDCCSRTCTRPDGPDGRPQGRKRCLCRETLELPCGGRCCGPNQTCKRGRCVHHCQDGRISGDESDRDCGGDDCKKCEILQQCDRPSDCTSGHCAPVAAFNDAKTRCVECTADVHCGNAEKPRCFTGGDPGAGGVCVRCLTDDHCLDEAAPFCESGDCVQCRDELECPPGQLCEGGTCRECIADSNCPTGEVCVGFQCIVPATCPAGADLCRDGFVPSTSCGAGCRCFTTGTNQTLCLQGIGSRCPEDACTADAECVSRHGPGAFCVVDTGTFCGCRHCAARC